MVKLILHFSTHSTKNDYHLQTAALAYELSNGGSDNISTEPPFLSSLAKIQEKRPYGICDWYLGFPRHRILRP